jgi:hypothetical protein
MQSHDASFHSHLRREVGDAGKRYEMARQKVFVLIGERPGPRLAEATAGLSAALKAYVSALRRLAHYAAHQAETRDHKPVERSLAGAA